MQHIYLVSDLGCTYLDDDGIHAKVMDNAYGFLDQLKKELVHPIRVVNVASAAKEYHMNDLFSSLTKASFEMSGFSIAKWDVIDERFTKDVKTTIRQADLVFLAGGGIQSQAELFAKIDLKNMLADYQGMIIGLSAGAINAAYEVNYVSEDIKDTYVYRFPGLGLTKLNILPHFDYALSHADILDKLVKASMEASYVGLPDGSFVEIVNGNERFVGTYYILQNGQLETVDVENEKET